MDDIVNELKVMRGKLKEMAQDKFAGETVTRQQISAITPGNPFVDMQGVNSYRIPSEDPEDIFLLVIMGPRSYFRLHDHDCPERVFVAQGSVIFDDVRLNFTDSIRINPYIEHRLYSEHGCILIVEFPKTVKPDQR